MMAIRLIIPILGLEPTGQNQNRRSHFRHKINYPDLGIGTLSDSYPHAFAPSHKINYLDLGIGTR